MAKTEGTAFELDKSEGTSVTSRFNSYRETSQELVSRTLETRVQTKTRYLLVLKMSLRRGLVKITN